MKSIAEIASEFSQLGPDAVQHMAELLERSPENLHPPLLRFARATAGMVGKEERLYDCPECLDKAFVIVTDWSKLYRREVERVQGCQRCPAGLRFEAAMWLDVVSPKGEKGKRHDSEEGWRQFNKSFAEKIRQREAVVAQMRLFQGEKRQPGEEG